MNLIIFLISIIIVIYVFKLSISGFNNDSVEITLDFDKIDLSLFNDDIIAIISSFKRIETTNVVMEVVENDKYRIGRYIDKSKKEYYYINVLNSKVSYKGSLEQIKEQIIKRGGDINIIKYIICASISLTFNVDE